MTFSHLKTGAVLAVVLLTTGCNSTFNLSSSGSSRNAELVWGQFGMEDGSFTKPRVLAIDQQDRLFIADRSGRIQVFSRDGEFLRKWWLPKYKNGMPSGLTIDDDGNLLVADTHYFRMLVYQPDGKLLKDRTIGGFRGYRPGEFNLVTDVDRDSQGNYYIAEYGEYDRIQKFTPEGEFVLQWGKLGRKPGEFVRPQNITIDKDDNVWVADACNHRIQVFSSTGKLLKIWGEEGHEPGMLNYPYDLCLDEKGHLYVCEFGNSRIQKFTLDGKLRGVWGTYGRDKGQLSRPWSLARDSKGRIHVIDTYNHRVQRIRL